MEREFWIVMWIILWISGKPPSFISKHKMPLRLKNQMKKKTMLTGVHPNSF